MIVDSLLRLRACTMKRQNVRTLLLIAFTMTFLFIGAAIFGAFESDYETEQRELLMLEERELRRKYNISDEDFQRLTTNIVRSIPHKAGIQWKFAGAFYFSTTVITTIGYGHSTPQTTYGKIFCMLYALLGIPLNLVMFQSIGERLNAFTTFILTRVKRRIFHIRDAQVSHTHLTLVATTTSVLVVVCGAWAFSRCEGWSYLDSFYYCVITLTTVGLGDLVALQKDRVLQTSPEYVAFSIFFILFGLAVVSAAMNLLILRFLTMNTDDERRDQCLRHFRNSHVVAAIASCQKTLTVHVTSAATPNGAAGVPQLPSYEYSKSPVDRCRKPLMKLFRCCSSRNDDIEAVSLKHSPDGGSKLRYRVTRSPVRTVAHLLIGVNNCNYYSVVDRMWYSSTECSSRHRRRLNTI